MKTLPPFA